MNKKTLTLRLSVSVVFFFSQAAFSALLQSPIQVTAGTVPPNLMFTLDDSGSMGFECLPDALCISGSNYVGTMPDMTPSWKNGVATPDSRYVFSRRMRSSTTNPLYYDPNIRYQAWMKKDGSRMTDAVAATARLYPENTRDTSTYNLTIDQNMRRNWCTAANNCDSSTESIYLAQYYDLTGSNKNNISSYTLVNIRSGNSTDYPRGSGPKGVARTDCVGTRCTGNEELKNFANWFSYHRSRMRVAIAGTSEAFYTVPQDYRVGYGRINKSTSTNIDDKNVSTIEQGVRPFNLDSGGSKSAFYDWLNEQVPRTGGTPLRRALDDVGQYFSYTNSKGPWGETPGFTSATPAIACRRSFHVLMTDGMWNSAAASTTDLLNINVDNSNGPIIPAGPNSPSYQYTPTRPYRDDYSNTLADVAMYYWSRDLNTLVDNAVRPTSTNPAYWQHLVNYTISFGVDGTLDSDTALPALTAGTTTWPQPSNDATENIDDLWHAAVNSRGRYLSARNTNEYADALKKIINEIAAINGSEAGVAVSAKAISASTVARKYEPTFASEKWSGDVEAIRLKATGANDGIAWRASEHFPAPAERKIFVYNAAATSGVKSLAFNWASMTDAMKIKLFGATAGGEDLVNFLRGERTNENVTYRVRASVLGDIVNSAPVLVKDQFDGQYDFLPTKAAADSYRRFLGAKKLREPQLFVGANDGMLHAFSDNTGAESFAYVPDSVLGKMKKLSDKDYEHDYYVDGPTIEGDIYDAGATKWRNVVFGGTGAGGKSLYAINVPVVPWAAGNNAPSAYTAAQSAPGAADVLWEVSPAKTGFEELGNVLSTPEHGVMRNGTWVVIVGNGVEGANKKAQLYIINALTGTLIKTIDTGVGSLSSPNGLGGVRVVRDAQKQIVAAYAGDLQGNMWKFDLSSSVASDWNVAFGNTATARNPLYKTAPVEPITAAPTFIVHPSGGVMVLFGSGKLFEVGDAADQSARALYGVWDKVPLGAASATASDRVMDNSTIVAQAFSTTAAGGTAGAYYGLTVTPVDYASKRGWRLPLTLASGQRLVDEPEISVGRVFMQTVSPTAAVASCSASSILRHGIALDPFMNAISSSTFDTTGDNLIDIADNMFAVAVRLNSNGPASVVRKYGTSKSLLLGAGTGGLEFQGGSNSSKRYWRQIVNQP